ncbi:uncharacterized protein K441DRAFT_678858 [Cenococcum geophilum 1.58]|uniref:uncharacterized protein n=1 Tax=Cenococcum geophilum 1.58 TaxID=794803 RepID=UPI00358F0C3B|nr:hypothetical protein K441DRAFT_678858 [Cenococcum geophilum 1.58]
MAKKKAKARKPDPGSTTPPSAKRRGVSTHGQSGRAPKTPKLASYNTPPPSNEGAEDVSALLNKTPATKRMHSHSGMIEREHIIYATDTETQIAAEARGVMRKNIPLNTFRSIYLCDFKNTGARPKLDVKPVKKIGKGNWEETLFGDRLCQVLSDEVLRDLKLSYSGTKTLSDTDKGKEMPSKPDFSFHVDGESPTWANVELLIEHTRFKEVVTQKFLQWLRGAWSVFHHQPFRRHLYGILFINPHAYICYTDHGCAAYSEPLDFVKDTKHTRFLIEFLSGFIAEPEHRGKDPTVEKEDSLVYIRHAGERWLELPNGLLCYRPSLVGRNIRVTRVEQEGSKFPERRVVMKSTWEEKPPQKPSPPPEAEILNILLNAGVRGLPQIYGLESAIVRDNDELEVETRSFSKSCKVALPASTADRMSKMQSGYVSGHTSKFLAPGAAEGLAGDPPLRRLRFEEEVERKFFKNPIEVHRRLVRIIMSYCKPLKDAMRDAGPESLMQTIRDSMIVYYEAYKLPESGFIHGVPVAGSKLTGGLTYEDRRGTLVDWNLCFTADGTASNRNFRSGTPAFMAPALLKHQPIGRRTLAHDMESYFAVIIWIASLDYEREAIFQAKPLAKALLNGEKSSEDIANAKKSWFNNVEDFVEEITDYFEPPYLGDRRFLRCLDMLRQILYPRDDLGIDAYWDKQLDQNNREETEDVDPAKEGLFLRCMKEIDDYLEDEKGSREIEWINEAKAAKEV